MAIENRVGEDRAVTDKLRITFSPKYLVKINELRKTTGLTNARLIGRLIDVAYAEDAGTIELIRKGIVKRIKNGVGYGYMTQLKLLHTVLTYYLKRAGYL